VHGTGSITEDQFNCIINRIRGKIKEVMPATEDEDSDEAVLNGSLAMINSNFKVDYEIRQSRLHSLIMNEYGMPVNFDDNYQGVKIQYLYNPQNNTGLCHCTDPPCAEIKNKKKRKCHNITIAVFKAGSTLIEGGNITEHLDAAYEFISGVLISHKEDLRLKSPQEIEITTSKDDCPQWELAPF
jgi:hypothetical protein